MRLKSLWSLGFSSHHNSGTVGFSQLFHLSQLSAVSASPDLLRRRCRSRPAWRGPASWRRRRSASAACAAPSEGASAFADLWHCVSEIHCSGIHLHGGVEGLFNVVNNNNCQKQIGLTHCITATRLTNRLLRRRQSRVAIQ